MNPKVLSPIPTTTLKSASTISIPKCPPLHEKHLFPLWLLRFLSLMRGFNLTEHFTPDTLPPTPPNKLKNYK